MIRIIAELRDGGIARDISPGTRISGAVLDQEFDDNETNYGSRPWRITIEEDTEA